MSGGVLTIKYPLDSLTFYARWTEKANSKITIVIWKQKIDDAVDATNADKHYDYYSLDVASLPTVIENIRSGQTLSDLNSTLSPYRGLTTNANTRNDFIGFQLRTTDPVVMSDERVRGDGSTVVNIYYDRSIHTLQFQIQQGSGWGATWTTIKTIRALYEQNISSNFPIVGTNGVTYNQGQRWEPQSSTPYNQVLVYIDIMPNADVTFHLNTSTNGTKYIYYYIEPLPGADLSGKTTRTYNGTTFVEYKKISANYGFFTEAEDYIDLIGFSKGGSTYPPQGFDADGTTPHSQLWNSGGASVIYCYYTRNDYTLTFDYNYPVAAGMADKTVDISGVLYETSLIKYGSGGSDAVWVQDSEIPDHYEFKGWFEDAAGTVEFEFDNTTMPAADKIIYGKWEPVYYLVKIDPNGGVINHINYDEHEDGDGYAEFNIAEFSTGTGATWDAARDAVNGDTTWVSVLAATGSGHRTDQSTYFSAEYNTAIGEYELQRKYVEYDGTAEQAAGAGKTVYYYVNMQFDNLSGVWGLHADMRNALYLTEAQLEAYYKYCLACKAWNEAARPGYYDGQLPTTYNDFKEQYVKKENGSFVLYELNNVESYEFVGWYPVVAGDVADDPYIFSANVVTEAIELRAVWRRIGSFYVSYNPVYETTVNGVDYIINGNIVAWSDPANHNSEKYIDGAYTTTLQQPTGLIANGQDASETWTFRGWQIVKDVNGVQTPVNGIYYEPAASFRISASFADADGCIHMQAIYQMINESDRRPHVANLILDANDGYLIDANGDKLNADPAPATLTVESDWKGANIATVTGWGSVGTVAETIWYEDEHGTGHDVEQIEFGDMQSNFAVHLHKYAVKNGMLAGLTSKSFFKHDLDYLLIGFDEGSDYTLETTATTADDIRTGDAYVPTYPADAVISVQRTDNVTLYAVWEPMVYVTFTNRSSQPVTFNIIGSGESMSIVNEVTGVFGREKFTSRTITLDAGEHIKLVMPKGIGHTFTIDGTNTNTAQLLNITSWFNGSQTAMTTAGLYRSSGADFELTDTLHSDPVGVQVYFDGVDTVFFDVNGGTWTDPRTGSSYDAVVADSSLVYVKEDGLHYEPIEFPNAAPYPTVEEPRVPTRSGYTFIGWTTESAVADPAFDPAGYTLPGTDPSAKINNLAVIRNGLLWDFSTPISEGMTLYAVWSETLTVTYHITNNHTWRESDNSYFVPGSNRTYVVTLVRGDIVRVPQAPTWNNSNQFYRWVTVTSHQSGAKSVGEIDNIYAFGEPLLASTDLYTSWINASHINVTVSKTVNSAYPEDLTKDFTFTAVITTTTYSRTVTRSASGWIIQTPSWDVSSSTTIDTTEEIQTITLKNGESSILPLYYYNENNQTISSTGTYTISIFFQSVTITEASDPNFTVAVNGNTSNTITVDTKGNSNPTWTAGGNNNSSSRTFRLSATYAYSNNANVSAAFTNNRTKTDVIVKKVVDHEHDDYYTGNEEFSFTAVVKNDSGIIVEPASNPLYDYTVEGSGTSSYASFVLKDGESAVIHGVPIGGSIVVTENAPGYTAVSTHGSDPAGAATFTLSDVPKEIQTITYTNTRNVFDVEITNSVPGYGKKTKSFVYTATLWDGDTQVAFPSSITNASFSNNRKTLTVALKDQESYIIKDLPTGYKLIVTQAEEDYYTTTVGLHGDTPTASLSYTLSSIQDDTQIDFVNNLKVGSYTVSKSVQLNPGDPPDTNVFNFTAVLLETAGSNTRVALSQDIIDMAEALGASVSNNEISFSLRDGEDINLTLLPAGYYLQVQESAPGYAAYVSGNRTDSVTVQIEPGSNSDINYINRKAETILKVYKLDRDDDSPLQGGVFILYKMNGSEPQTLFTLTSNAAGLMQYEEASMVSSEMSLENGTYYLKEITPPIGYKDFEEIIKITIDNINGLKIYKADGTAISSNYAQLDGPINLNQYTITVKDERALIAPTGIDFNNLPFVMMAILGLLLCLIAVFGKKARQEEMALAAAAAEAEVEAASEEKSAQITEASAKAEAAGKRPRKPMQAIQGCREWAGCVWRAANESMRFIGRRIRSGPYAPPG